MVNTAADAVKRIMTNSFTSADRRTRLVSAAVAVMFVASCVLAVAVAGVFDIPGGHRVVVPAPVSAEQAEAPTTVVETRFVDDPYYVASEPIGGSTSDSPAAAPGGLRPQASPALSVPGVDPGGGTPATGALDSAPAAGAGPQVAPVPRPALAPTPSPTAPSVTTPPAAGPQATVPGPTTTSTTLPAGARIPRDWPPGKPIPPIPPGCRKPVLEDNGVWNCDH